MVGVSASVNLPMHHKVQNFSSGIGSQVVPENGCGVVLWWSAVAERGDRLPTIDMGRKEGAAVPLSGKGGSWILI